MAMSGHHGSIIATLGRARDQSVREWPLQPQAVRNAAFGVHVVRRLIDLAGY
jgi:hypothetical protein